MSSPSDSGLGGIRPPLPPCVICLDLGIEPPNPVKYPWHGLQVCFSHRREIERQQEEERRREMRDRLPGAIQRAMAAAGLAPPAPAPAAVAPQDRNTRGAPGRKPGIPSDPKWREKAADMERLQAEGQVWEAAAKRHHVSEKTARRWVNLLRAEREGQRSGD